MLYMVKRSQMLMREVQNESGYASVAVNLVARVAYKHLQAFASFFSQDFTRFHQLVPTVTVWYQLVPQVSPLHLITKNIKK